MKSKNIPIKIQKTSNIYIILEHKLTTHQIQRITEEAYNNGRNV